MPNDASALLRAYVAIEDLESRLDEALRRSREPVAIIGMGCRFPESPDPESFWRTLRDGVDTAREVPADRWDIDAYYDPDPGAPGKMYTRSAAFLGDVDGFDPTFFGISPREAASIDPQHRLLLEVCWEALERAGKAPDRLVNTSTGVFVGLMTADYARIQVAGGDAARADAYTGIGSDFSFAAGRLSYTLGLRGPSMAVATACSSSLVAIHLACQSLRERDCDMALAGGVNLMLSPETTILLCRMRALAPDGRSKTFDASADGYGRGEGAGAVVLKRLSDAVADGDDILAVIRGSAINHDGPSGGLTVPNGVAQEALLRSALANAGVRPEDLGYVETHGTGTSLGDPIEIRALGAALGARRDDASRLLIGSVKTNIGHLEAASGIASIIKVVLALKHQEIPPHLHLKERNPYIAWDELPLRVPTERTPWERGSRPRIAGVSSFGLSGINAHVVVEEAPPAPGAEEARRAYHLLPLSAKTEGALRELAGRFERRLADADGASLADICFTAGAGRSRFSRRLAVVGSSADAMRSQLAAFVREGASSVMTGAAPAEGRPRVAFLFTGQGSQYTGMGRSLYETQPTFRRALDRCDELLRGQLERPLLSIFYPEGGAPSPLDETACTQPALFALEYALTELWRSFGVEPDAVMGHSVGELAAACAAGVFGVEEGLSLIAARGRLMQALPAGGEMAAIFADAEIVAEAVAPHADRLVIAAVNGPADTVISGDGEALRLAVARLRAQGIEARRLHVSHAFHSPLMDPMLDDFQRIAARISYEPPRVTFISNLTGAPSGPRDIGAAYLRRHLREPVQFQAGMRALAAQGYDIFVEIGPRPTLLGAARRAMPESAAAFLPSLRRGRDDWQQMLESLGALHTRGVEVDFRGVDQGRRPLRVALPTYPFERTRCWSPGEQSRPKGPLASSMFDHHLKSPLLAEVLFEAELSAERVPLLLSHRIFGEVIVPGAYHLAMALSAAGEALGAGAWSIEAVELLQALVLPEGASRKVQLAIKPADDGRATFQVISLAPDAQGGFVRHAVGVLAVSDGGGASEPVAPGPIAGRCGDERPAAELYAFMAERELEIGPELQWLTRVRSRDGEALGHFEPPRGAGGGVQGRCAVQPGLLDACFQLAACAAVHRLSGDLMVPVGVERVAVHRSCDHASLWGHAALRPDAGDGAIVGDIRLFDERGAPVVEVAGLRAVRASREALVGDLAPASPEEDLYEIDWRPSARVEPRSGERRPDTWLLLVDRQGIGARLAERLRARGEACVVVCTGAAFARAGADFCVDPARPEDFPRLLAEIGEPALRPTRVVHLLSLDASAEGTSLDAALALGCASALHLVQALVEQRWSGELCLVTRGAQPAGAAPGPIAVAQAPLWGLGLVIAGEHPELRVARVDLDPADHIDPVDALLDELGSRDGEDQVALRREGRLVARLRGAAGPRRGEAPRRGDAPVRLEISKRGELANLAFSPAARARPGADEVEIRVRAVGLNFRDVLNALGMYPGDPGPLGLECAGTITALGEGVSGFALGDEVMALAPACFATYVVAPSSLIFKKPPRLSFEDAATIPVAFLTAYHVLHHIARISRGDSVLIHAAAGGVGVAAVQLALRAGAEVYATASPGKWDFVRALGVRHVMSSRTLDFAEEVMTRSGGRGVDVVLNSLTGEFIPKSLGVLRPGGTFLEIGKREIWSGERVAAVKSGISYVAFDLVELSREDPSAIHSMFREIAAALEGRSIEPIRSEIFPMSSVMSAFRHMSHAKHTGKVVITQPAEAAAAPGVREDATYLITGGLGALGLLVARWLVGRGARHLVLVGRSEPSASAQEVIAELRRAGAELVIARGDVARRDDVTAILADIRRSMPALRGVIHSAGVLDDGVLLQQTMARLTRVMAPKVLGAGHLHEGTRGTPLDFFVLFSSVASLLGSLGQGPYAAGNAFLDALAHHRRAQGLPALSINWGPWAEVGMAASLAGQAERRWAEIGVRLLSPDRALGLLERLLARDVAQAAAVEASWPVFVERRAGGAPPLLSELIGDARTGPPAGRRAAPQPDLLLQLAGRAAIERREIIVGWIREKAAQVLGFEPSRPLDTRRPLNEIGLDSLMAVELRNALAAGAGLTLSATLLFEHPSVESLAGYLDGLLAPASAAEPEAPSAPRVDPRAELVEEIQGLSESEAAALLEAELAALHPGR